MAKAPGDGGPIATVPPPAPTGTEGGRGPVGPVGSPPTTPGGGGGSGSPPTTPITPPAAPTADQTSAKGLLDSFLQTIGLTSLGDWAWQKLLSGDGVNQIMLELRSTDAYKARFPAMAELDKQGAGMTEASYINYEQSYKGMLHAAGIALGIFDDPAHIAKMLTGHVDLTEAADRIKDATAITLSLPASERQWFTQQFGVGKDQGALTAMFLDPDKALPVLNRNLAMAAVGGAAIDQNLGVDADTAARLADQGITYNQALQGFGQVAQTDALGSSLGGETADQSTRIKAAFGDTTAQNDVTRVQKGRLVADQGSGRLAEAAAGVTGLQHFATN